MKELIEFDGKKPKVHETAYIASGVKLIGDVEIGENASIWHNAVLRGDSSSIKVGKNSNLQDCSVVHTTRDTSVTEIGDNVSVGHNVIIHGAKINNNCIIGMGAILLDNCEIGENSIVGAGTLVTKNKKFPPNSLILGRPAKVAKELDEEGLKQIKYNYEYYLDLKKKY